MAVGEYPAIWKALCGVIAADATTIALLGSGASGVFYSEDKLPSQPVYPIVRVHYVHAGEDESNSSVGDLTLRWQCDVFGVSQDKNWQVARLLRDLLDIPRKRPQGITATGWRVIKNTYRDAHPVGGTGIQVDGHEVQQLSLDFELRALSAS